MGHQPAPVLSFHGELHEAPKKRFEETVVLVPFFGAKKHQLRRHSEYLTKFGFDNVVFDLRFKIDENIVSPQAGFGLKHVWADQIERILNEVPGRKIIHAFSNPSASAIEAIARRNAYDVQALICEGGPSAKLWISMLNYYKVEEPISFGPWRWLSAFAGTLVWAPNFLTSVHHDLDLFPKDFRILSIRGWKDPLIPPSHIDGVFEPHHQIRWTRANLPKGGHVNGLKDFADEYVPQWTGFLEAVGTPLGPRE